MEQIPISDIVNIVVSELCQESFPCYHALEIMLNNSKIYHTGMIFAVDIMHLHEMTGLTLPKHFKVYQGRDDTMHIDHIDKLFVIPKPMVVSVADNTV